MKKSLFLSIFFLCMSLFGETKNDVYKVGFTTERLLPILSNRDVFWTYEYLGVVPYLSPNAEAVLQAQDGATSKILKTWLQDPSRFVIAHVLLTLSGESGRYPINASEWNGLHVTISVEGTAIYDLSQMEPLFRKWHEQAEKPRVSTTDKSLASQVRNAPNDPSGTSRASK